MNKYLKIGLIGLGLLVIVFSAFIAYAYYFNPRIYTLCCISEEEFTTEFIDREFVFRYTRSGGFEVRGLTIQINGDGTFEKEMGSYNPLGKVLIEKGRLSKEDMLLLVSRIESGNFFNLPKELKRLDCYDASETSLTISLDDRYHVVSEYCSFDTPEGNEYRSLVSLVSQMTTKGGYRE
ncbi:hypothetical protein HY500_04360 [Candidatus Woesearchaeota archaeon]|nr:hypothetical protein [Candidatus Woesearchaeota archaeon]